MMVEKYRVRSQLVPVVIQGISYGSQITEHVAEGCADSSVTGSARTDLSAVDSFLADPANTRARGFQSALQQSYLSAGDAGIAQFRVDREKHTNTPDSGVFFDNAGNSYSFSNFVMRWPSDYTFPDIVPWSVPNKDQMDAKGQRLYLSALPNRDQADLGTVIGEIVANPVRAAAIPGQALVRALQTQRGLSTAAGITSRARSRHRQIRGLPLEEARAAADDYLAYIFGARPTVNSLDQLAESINRSRRSAETVVRSSVKDKSARRIRRRRSDPSKYSVDTYTSLGEVPFRRDQNPLVLRGTLTYKTEATQDVWFSASFRMPVSDTETWLDKCDTFFHTVDRITGLGLDIRTAWDLIPFSFMVDWFSNTGDLLEVRQVVSDYNIVCEYGYIMCHTRYLRTLDVFGMYGQPAPYYYGGSTGHLTYSKLQEVKQREQSKSFGFNTDFSSLNSFQWSALSALGLTYAAGNAPRTRS